MKKRHKVIRIGSVVVATFLLLLTSVSQIAYARSQAIAEPKIGSSALKYDFNAARTSESAGISGPGSGELRMRVLGDVMTAKRIAVIVPGMGNDASNFSFDDGLQKAKPTHVLFQAQDLYREMKAQDPTTPIAVIAWLGYENPGALNVAFSTTNRDTGSANLAALQKALENDAPQAHVTWACQSYGTLVCSGALQKADPDTLIVVASPGLGVDKAADLPTKARIVVGQGDADVIGWVPGLDSIGIGFGTDPADPDFGAETLPTDPGTDHLGYFIPGSTQIKGIAAIALQG